MAERRKSRVREEQEPVAEEPEALEEDEVLDEGEPEEDDLDEAGQDSSPANGRGRSGGRGPRGRRGRGAMTAGDAAQVALQQIATLTAKQPEGVTEIARTEDGWTVGVELVEDQRIPSSSDILATYETTIDADGELVSYRRVRRYARGRGDAEES